MANGHGNHELALQSLRASSQTGQEHERLRMYATLTQLVHEKERVALELRVRAHPLSFVDLFKRSVENEPVSLDRWLKSVAVVWERASSSNRKPLTCLDFTEGTSRLANSNTVSYHKAKAFLPIRTSCGSNRDHKSEPGLIGGVPRAVCFLGILTQRLHHQADIVFSNCTHTAFVMALDSRVEMILRDSEARSLRR
jgi:hypothetical protein